MGGGGEGELEKFQGDQEGLFLSSSRVSFMVYKKNGVVYLPFLSYMGKHRLISAPSKNYSPPSHLMWTEHSARIH